MRYHFNRFRTMGILQAILFFACVFPLHAAELSDDIIILRNGDIIKGMIIKMEGGVLLVKTLYSEPIKIKWPSIEEIKTAHPVSVLLVNGETLIGTFETGPEGNFVLIQTEYTNRVAIQWNDVQAINAPPVKWNGNVSIGALSQTGNSDTKSASFSAEGVRRTAKDRYSARLLFNYAEEADTITSRNTFGIMKYDHFFTNNAYSFLALELLNDTFKDISLRTVAGPGIGYQVWDDKDKALSIELGVAYTSEDRVESEDDEWIAGRSSVSFRINAFDIATLSDSVLAYINFEDGDDYQVRNEASISSAIGSSWSLKISNIIEYDNKPAEKIDKTDVIWIAGLQYAF